MRESIEGIEQLFNDDTLEYPAAATATGERFGAAVKEPDSIRAAGAIREIMRILADVDEKFHQPIFQAVESLRRVTAGESVQAIGNQLDEIDRARRRRANGRTARRRWFYLRLDHS
jgi:hypothetical protein